MIWRSVPYTVTQFSVLREQKAVLEGDLFMSVPNKD